jgi:hypothetical protein
VGESCHIGFRSNTAVSLSCSLSSDKTTFKTDFSILDENSGPLSLFDKLKSFNVKDIKGTGKVDAVLNYV